MAQEIKSTKHSAFIRVNGINPSMRLFEQLIMDISEDGCKIVFQHDGQVGKDLFVYSEPFLPSKRGVPYH